MCYIFIINKNKNGWQSQSRINTKRGAPPTLFHLLLPIMPSETLISHFKPSTSPLNSSKPPTPTTTSPPPPPTAAQPMICTAKSSNWLDRLRSSRGFPDSDHIDLEHFLSTSTDKTDSSVIKFTCKKPLIDENFVAEKRDDDNKSVQKRDLINNVLSELFYMGECEEQSRIKMEKSCRNRKQLCPRVHVVLANSDVRNDTAARKDRVSLSSGRKVKEVSQVKECVGVGEGEGEEKGGRDCDLSAYSQTEVTVIDTSVPCWKFEKVLYRSKNVWKVGDRKGKGLMNGDKKRKERVSESGGDVPKKKLKKKMKLSNSLKADQGRDQGKVVAGNEKKRDNSSQLQEKSFCKKQIDEGSSVILIKSIPTTNKKNASGISNGCVKSMQR
ncbi:hypothetical protein HanXRQr2_Chr08g0340201 [Helianthus annuus]|uniref:Uncharacterized protein n=2 Tax=Helianthus annuus TaxID=4232 RepID=A0A9K3ND82_HELAN|nr:hypothetical protein HanXRQr2_Chr08g0340201 [Helianthus annuus]KAJ0901719.1 hypothetical protein HanPSC8_Chr08g0328591 [Helianthus annuus]